MPERGRIRAFVGIPVPDALVASLEGVQSRLRAGRMVAEDNLHLTLVFLGAVQWSELDDVHEALDALPPMTATLELRGLDMMAGGRVLAMRADAGPELRSVQARVLRAVRMAGIEIERRRFRPHVTLARLSRDAPPEELARAGKALEAMGDLRLPPHRTTGFALYRSHLSEDGADYEILAEYPEMPGL